MSKRAADPAARFLLFALKPGYFPVLKPASWRDASAMCRDWASQEASAEWPQIPPLVAATHVVNRRNWGLGVAVE